MRLLKMFVSQAFFWGFILCYCFGFEGLRFFGLGQFRIEDSRDARQGCYSRLIEGVIRVLLLFYGA